DAGGTRGISQLKILDELMHRLNFEAKDNKNDRPCAVFDMIGGTGTGGFISLLLVILGLTTEQALEEFIDLSSSILDLTGVEAPMRTLKLKEHIARLLGKYGIDEKMRLMDKNKRSKGCKLAVPISDALNMKSICTLRNYDARQEKSVNITVAEALVATLAIPPLFTPTPIFKDASTFHFIGADFSLGNPAQHLITEAYGAFGPEALVACVLSLGCGHPGIITTPSNSDVDKWNSLVEKLIVDSEQKSQQMESQMGHLGLYYRFCVTHGLERVDTTAPLGPSNVIVHTAVYLGDVSVSQKFDLSVNSVTLREGIASLDQLSESIAMRVFPPALPPVTSTFVMRKEPWEFIEKAAFGTEEVDGLRMLAVTGIGGCGKTQIILKFASTFFIDGSSEERIRADILYHVRSLGLGYSQMGFEDCLRFLAQPIPGCRRLIVYDSVDDPNLNLLPLLPYGDFCIIFITSRNRSIGELCPETHLELGVMSTDEAVTLLLGAAGSKTAISDSDQESASALSQALGCHPIALAQARSYMSQTQCSCSAYLERLSDYRDKLLAMPIGNQSVYAAFEASFTLLDRPTKRFLRLLSYFHWNGIPLELFFLAARHRFSEYEHTYIEHGDGFLAGKTAIEGILFEEGNWDITHLDQMIISLQNCSLVSLSPGVGTTLLEMHALVHGWLQDTVPSKESSNYQSAAILLLSLGDRREYTPSARYLTSHVLHLSPIWNKLHVNDARAFAHLLKNGGSFRYSLTLREHVVAMLKEQVDPQSFILLEAQSELALAYGDLGQWKEAETIQVEVLRLMKAIKGERDPATITASINLRCTYRELGRPSEAETLQKEVLRLNKEILGKEHLDTIAASRDLSLIYRDLGRYDEAKVLQMEILDLGKEVLGERHPDTIRTLSCLAITYHDLGLSSDAENLQVDVLNLRKEILGENHPDTIMALNDLAATYRELYSFEKAKEAQMEVLRLNRKYLGERHPNTILASSNLALTYYDLGLLMEAERLQLEVLNISKEVMGDSHPDTLAGYNNLAITYRDLERSEEAKKLQLEVLRLSKETLGELHPDTIVALSNLAVTYHDLGEREQAVKLQVEVLSLRKKLLGDSHPDTLVASNNLASTYHDLGRFGEAEVLQVDVLKLRRALLGERHPDTLAACNNLSVTLKDLGRSKEAEARQLDIVWLSKEVLGPQHPDTV
ncbi:hypothetical protein M408DRAFT_57060, partial [Serendipita vermifera MAFF 305830]